MNGYIFYSNKKLCLLSYKHIKTTSKQDVDYLILYYLVFKINYLVNVYLDNITILCLIETLRTLCYL